jgi:acyl phosphate:glycerol-3-phosphate acyltransferase
LLVWRHFPNIQRLMAGTESRLGRKKPAAEAAAKPPAHHTPHKAHKKGHS